MPRILLGPNAAALRHMPDAEGDLSLEFSITTARWPRACAQVTTVASESMMDRQLAIYCLAVSWIPDKENAQAVVFPSSNNHSNDPSSFRMQQDTSTHAVAQR
mmetsp:Transcript_46164/g.76324  ORF Transcript_46164/g.76324 Transcript_46164/m.76324 type:complete len:103 (+) Transcript_46164:95-403(+)